MPEHIENMLAAKGSVRTVKNQWAFRVTNNHVLEPETGLSMI